MLAGTLVTLYAKKRPCIKVCIREATLMDEEGTVLRERRRVFAAKCDGRCTVAGVVDIEHEGRAGRKAEPVAHRLREKDATSFVNGDSHDSAVRVRGVVIVLITKGTNNEGEWRRLPTHPVAFASSCPSIAANCRPA